VTGAGIEVHISNVHAREPISPSVVALAGGAGIIIGFGGDG